MNETLSKFFPAYKSNNNAIVFETSLMFVPFLSVAILSLLKNTVSDQNYDIIILSNELDKESEEALAALSASMQNAQIRCLNPHDCVKKYIEEAKHTYAEINYYRLALPWILLNYDKVINLGADLIVNEDVSKLYSTNLSKHYIAGVKDIAYSGRIHLDIPKSELELSGEDTYINADVLIYDLKKIRSRYSQEEMLGLWQTYRFRYAEQDAINKLFDGHVFHLDMRWNVFPANASTSRDIEYASSDLLSEWQNAKTDPYIIHYASLPKPWEAEWIEYGDLWWEYAELSPFYPALKENLSRSAPRKQSKVTNVLDKLFPLNSRTSFFWIAKRNIQSIINEGHLNRYGMNYRKDK